MFKNGSGSWVEYRKLEKVKEVDFHRGRRDPEIMYWDAMQKVRDDAVAALRSAQADGYEWVLFTHGWSTSGSGKTSSRSQIRGLMRSTEATPYILKSKSIQHESVFVARIRCAPA